MAVNNSLAQKAKTPSPASVFQQFIKNSVVQENLLTTLGDATRTKTFTASIISNVSMNPDLAKCKHTTIISAALLGETLKLSPSPQLGQFYMVPYKQKAKWQDGEIVEPECTVATFTLGYKGYLQLAIRSGQYKKLIVTNIKEGELISWNPMTEEIEVDPILDDDERSKRKTIGYYCYFELINGFQKAMYWSYEKMLNHADKYSPSFSKDATGGKYPKVSYADYVAGNIPRGTEWQYSSFWYKDFDGMAYKTMLRQIISRWGVMSIDMQTAYTNDMTFRNGIGESDQPQYTEEIVEPEQAEVVEKQPEAIPEQNPQPVMNTIQKQPENAYEPPVESDRPEPIEYSNSLF